MRYKFKPVTLAMVIGSALMLTACHKNQEKTDTEQTSSQQQNTMKELQTPPVKTFAATPEDAHDVAILEDFDRRFSEMNDEMEEADGIREEVEVEVEEIAVFLVAFSFTSTREDG